jgi:hypothetical protein
VTPLHEPGTLRFWSLAAAALVIGSGLSLALLGSVEVIPSIFRNPVSDFVQPGVTAWWFVLGGPFRSAPSSLSGIVFAAIANAALWLLGLFFLVGAVRIFRRILAAPRT